MGSGISKEKMKEYKDVTSGAMKQSDIQRLYKLFHQVASSGEMDMISFRKYASSAFPDAPSDANFDHLFRGMDRDNSGTITFQEFLAYHAVYQTSDVQELIEVVFAMYDEDDDGYVTRDEMIRCLANCTRLKGIDVKKPSNRSLIENRVDTLIRFADKNADGKLTKDEVLNAVEKNPSIINIL
eukprot:gb/GECH01013953.1/.p1 GENE.gb/GECH01013953.1/~~gb/GECH01013953.1/.p1  ORF type:complete len:183 (+),score=44.11 gb/GECH01013953.1/:1-549(+)